MTAMSAPSHLRHRPAPRAPAAGAWLKRLIVRLSAQAERDAARIATWPQTSIHALRKRMKKLQSLLRLAGPAVDSETLTALRASIRLLKSTVAAQRDADVLAALGKDLGSRPKAIRRKRPQTPAIIAFTQEVTSLVRQLDLDTLTWETVARSHLKTSRRARKAWHKARRDPTVEALHEWRMRVKDHYYQSLALHHWLQQPKNLRRARRLGALLGRCHDLDLFTSALSKDAARPKKKLVTKLRTRRDKLTRRIFQRAEKVFARSVPKVKRRVTSLLPASAPAPTRRRRAHPAPRSR